MKRWYAWLGAVMGLFVLTAAAGRAQEIPDTGEKPHEAGPLYTAYNLWYEDITEIYSPNFQLPQGMVLPAGTRVANVQVRNDKYLSFDLAEAKGRLRVQFRPEYHPGKTIDDLRLRLFTRQSLEERTKNFTDREKECIRKCTIENGISKDAVLIVCGYPPELGTPDVTSYTWTFWRNRFFKYVVEFDKDNRVSAIVGR